MKLNYYARLNDSKLCVDIVSTPHDYNDGNVYVPIADYNTDIIYRKWLGDQWSQDRYEPQVDTVVQEKLALLEQMQTDMQLAIAELAGMVV